MFALAILVLAGCQNDEIVNRHIINDGTIRYAVGMGQQAQSRSDIGAGS